MAGTRELTVKILGDSSSARRALGQLDSSTSQTQGRLSKTTKTLATLGTVGAVALAGLAKGAIEAAADAQKVSAQTDAVIKSTGAAAGVTAKHVGDLSHSLQGLSGVQDENIQRGANMLLTFTNIRNAAGKNNDIFDQATKTALDMSVALGQDAAQSALQLGKALNDPIKGVTALQRVGVTFTAAQKEQIKALVASGDVMGAQRVILAELSKEFGGSAKAAGDAQTPIEKLKLKFGGLQEKVGTALMPVLAGLTSALLGVGKFFSELPGPVQVAIGVLGGLVVTVLAISKAVQAWTAVQAALNVVLALNPIILVTLAVAGLVAGIVIAYQKSETFRNIVKGAFEAVTTAAGFMKDLVVTYFQTILNFWLSTAEWIVKGAAVAFGWVPGIGPKLKEAARAVEGFRDDVNAFLNGIKTGKVDIDTSPAEFKIATLRQHITSLYQQVISGAKVQTTPGIEGIKQLVQKGTPQAEGGIYFKPTYGLFGEAGPEAIIPLAPSKRDRARQLMSMFPPHLVPRFANGGMVGRPSDEWYRQQFVQNDANDPNRGRAGYVQAEDGSWVPSSFYGGKSTFAQPAPIYGLPQAQPVQPIVVAPDLSAASEPLARILAAVFVQLLTSPEGAQAVTRALQEHLDRGGANPLVRR